MPSNSQNAEIARPRGISRSVMVVKRKCHDPTYLSPILPNTSMYKQVPILDSSYPVRMCKGKAISLSRRPSVVVVGTKITRSHVLGICACYKHNQLVDIGGKLVVRASNCSKRFTSAKNYAFSVQYPCGLSITPTLLACADACSSSLLERVVKS